MRIGFDAHVLDGRNQGTKTVMLRLIDTLARRFPEHEFFVYCQHPHSGLDFSLPNLHSRCTIRRGAASYLLLTMPRASRIDDLDTMVFNFIQSPLMRNATVIMYDVLPLTHPQFFPLVFVIQCWVFFTVSLGLSRNIFTISEYSRIEILGLFPWPGRKIPGILNLGASFPVETYFSLDEPSATLPSLLVGSRYLLIVGRIEPRKNVQMAIDAFHAAAPGNVKLVIVGKRDFNTTVDTHGDLRIIELAGVSDLELISIYRNAELFLYPSLAEGFGLPLLDAVLFGLPVISSQRTSMNEVGAGAATFFDPADPDAPDWLAKRLAAHFTGNPVPRPELAVRLERAALYSWENSASSLIDGIAKNISAVH